VPYDPPTLEPALKKAMDRGIKVVTHEADNEKNTMVDIEAFDNSAYGAGLNVTFAQNPALIGGMRVKVGSDVYDGSVSGRLAALQEGF